MNYAKSLGNLIYGVMLSLAITRMFSLKLGIKSWDNLSMAISILGSFLILSIFSLFFYYYFINHYKSSNEYFFLIQLLFVALLPLTFHGILSIPFDDHILLPNPIQLQSLSLAYLYGYIFYFLFNVFRNERRIKPNPKEESQS